MCAVERGQVFRAFLHEHLGGAGDLRGEHPDEACDRTRRLRTGQPSRRHRATPPLREAMPNQWGASLSQLNHALSQQKCLRQAGHFQRQRFAPSRCRHAGLRRGDPMARERTEDEKAALRELAAASGRSAALGGLVEHTRADRVLKPPAHLS